ncbi:shikimate kinase [Carbonactinospora thermoautotrophica]|nr:shikimate kinase [Carbonactinospora thermoautotrophica]
MGDSTGDRRRTSSPPPRRGTGLAPLDTVLLDAAPWPKTVAGNTYTRGKDLGLDGDQAPEMSVKATPARPVPAARILLIGMMGAGKSTVGRAMSAATGWPYLDNDELVRRATGVPTRRILHERGVRALREAEATALRLAVEQPPPVIAGIAGGVVESPDDRRVLREGGFVVWLRARIETLAARIGAGSARADRPWLEEDPKTVLRRLYAGREPLYAEVASLIVDVDDATPEQTVTTILDTLRARAGG